MKKAPWHEKLTKTNDSKATLSVSEARIIKTREIFSRIATIISSLSNLYVVLEEMDEILGVVVMFSFELFYDEHLNEVFIMNKNSEELAPLELCLIVIERKGMLSVKDHKFLAETL